MRKPERKKFEQKLLLLQEAFVRNYNETNEVSKSERDDTSQDSIDFANRSYTQEFLLSLGNLERMQLQQVEDALKRVQTTDYGECSVCEEEIGLKRLHAAPWVDTCITCQEKQEREASQGSRAFSMLEEEPDLTTED